MRRFGVRIPTGSRKKPGCTSNRAFLCSAKSEFTQAKARHKQCPRTAQQFQASCSGTRPRNGDHFVILAGVTQKPDCTSNRAFLLTWMAPSRQRQSAAISINVNVGGYHCSILRTTIQIVVVLLFLSMLSWHATGMSLDPHWCTSWLLAWGGFAVLVGWKQVRLTSFKHWLAGLVVLLMVFALGWQASPEAWLMHVTCWTVLWTAPVGEARWLNGVQRVAPWFAATLLLVLGSCIGQGGNWGVEPSGKLPFALAVGPSKHCLRVACLPRHVGRTETGKDQSVVPVVARFDCVRVPSQRGTLGLRSLGSADGVGPNAKSPLGSPLGNRCGRGVCPPSSCLNLVPAEERVRIFVHVPDVLKTLDVGYNLKSATSSSERVQIWAWTLGDVSAIGGGSGSWKWAAEGHLQERIGKCDVSVRRAHSDLLQWLHELGWLPALVMLLLVWRQMWQVRMFFFLALPLLCFTFPTERAKSWSPWPFCFGRSNLEGNHFPSSKDRGKAVPFCWPRLGFGHFGWGVELGSTHTRSSVTRANWAGGTE